MTVRRFRRSAAVRAAAVAAPSPRASLGGRTGILASFAIAAAFGGLYAWALHLRHVRYDTYALDLGLFTQVVWNNLRGRWFDTTVLQFNYLSEHLSPALALVSPLFLAWPDAEALLVLQAVAVGGAGVGICLAARRWTDDPLSALLVQVGFHLAPTTGWVVRDEFHPIVLAMPAIAFATALLWRGRPRLAALVGALALLANEDAALWVAPFGLLMIAVGRRRAAGWGAALVVLAVGWLAAYMLVAVPAVRPPELGQAVPHPDVGAFSQCGSSLPAVVGCLAGDPLATLRRATTEGDRAALASIFAPTAGLGLLGPSLLVAGARWLVVLLGNDPPDFRAHYVALLVPAAYLAAGEAIGWLRRLARVSPRLLAALVAASSLAAYVLASPLPGGREYREYPRFSPERIAVLDRAVQLIPADPSLCVAATSSILPHLALRENVYLLFEGKYPLPDYRILDLRDPYPISDEDMRRHAAILLTDPRYRPIFYRDDVLVLKRGSRPPDRPADEVFGGQIRLMGYSTAPRDGRVRILLYWRSEGLIPTDYHFFVHLVDEGGRGFSQQDGELARGYLPATKWSPGTEVRDRIVISAPPLPDWDSYHLEVGWYDLNTGERLKQPDGDDHADLPLAARPG